MSPASYQTAPPRVVSISNGQFGIAHWAAKPAPWRLGQPCLTIRNPQSAIARAGNGTRTRDPNLGKVVLYQLSYSRKPRRVDAETGRRGRGVTASCRRRPLSPCKL